MGCGRGCHCHRCRPGIGFGVNLNLNLRPKPHPAPCPPIIYQPPIYLPQPPPCQPPPCQPPPCHPPVCQPPPSYYHEPSHWIFHTAYQALPPHTVFCGRDSNGADIYVGRGFYNGRHFPAKVIPSNNKAYICNDGYEIELMSYDVLVGHRYRWVHCHRGEVPFNAVHCGTANNGQPMFIGRGHWQGSTTVGKIHPTHRCLYLPYGGREHQVDSYEVLIHD